MRRVGRYSRIVVRILIAVIVGLLFMLGCYVLKRLSGRSQTTSFGTITSLPAAEVSSTAIERDSNRAEVGEFISASEEPINETVSPVMADPSINEEVEEPVDIPSAQQEVAPDAQSVPGVSHEAALQQENAVEPGVTEKKPVAAAAQPEAYCVKCRARRGMKDARRIVTKNNRNAMEGVCPVCGTRLFRFIATSN